MIGVSLLGLGVGSVGATKPTKPTRPTTTTTTTTTPGSTATTTTPGNTPTTSGGTSSPVIAVSETGPSGQGVTPMTTTGLQAIEVQVPAACLWVVQVTGIGTPG